MKKNLYSFLFGESQRDDEIAALVEDIADMDTEGASTLKVEKSPLSKIISALGIEGGSLEADPRGLSMSFDDGDLFRSAHALLNEPDAMHKLASAGWVYSLQGDIAQANEPADFRIRFLEIDEVEPQDGEAKYSDSDKTRLSKVSDIIKKGREFATAKPDHNEDNPVEFDDKSSSSRDKGVGDAKDGAQPEGKPKGSTKESLTIEGKSRRLKCDSCEALAVNGVATHEHGCPNSRKRWVASGDYLVPSGEAGYKDDDEQDESLSEARHKAGCTCGFCKNMGSFGKKPKETDEGPDDGETTDGEFKIGDSLTPQDVVDTMLECNPGTQPGILGTKSFSSTKVPSGHKDRPFSPAPGMVQPDNEIVNKQVKRKVNSGK